MPPRTQPRAAGHVTGEAVLAPIVQVHEDDARKTVGDSQGGGIVLSGAGNAREKGMTFFVPALPRRALASNGGSAGSHRNPWAVAEGKMSLTNETEEAIRKAYAPAIPVFSERVDILIVGKIAVGKRPKLED